MNRRRCVYAPGNLMVSGRSDSSLNASCEFACRGLVRELAAGKTVCCIVASSKEQRGQGEERAGKRLREVRAAHEPGGAGHPGQRRERTGQHWLLTINSK